MSAVDGPTRDGAGPTTPESGPSTPDRADRAGAAEPEPSPAAGSAGPRDDPSGSTPTPAPGTDPPDPGTDPSDPGEDLPQGPIFTLLRGLAELVGIDRIDGVWIFPPREIADGETAVVVLSVFHEERRRVLAAHYTARAQEREIAVHEHVEEYGIAPPDRIGRLIEGVLQRVEEDLANAAPRHADIRGRVDRWDALLDALRDDPAWTAAGARPDPPPL